MNLSFKSHSAVSSSGEFVAGAEVRIDTGCVRAVAADRLFKIKERTDGLDLKTALTGAGAQFNWILKTLLNILLTFLLSFTGCPTVLQNSIENSIEYSTEFSISN